MDRQTLNWYDSCAQTLAARYEAVVSPLAALRDALPASLFEQVFFSGCTVLDIGCGSGRDMAWLLSEGLDAWGLEPSAQMRQMALHYHPQLSGRVFAGGLPHPGLDAALKFDTVLCMASLMHVRSADVSIAVLQIRQLLKTGGYVVVSVPWLREDLDDSRREPGGRLFTDLSPEHLHALFTPLGFVLRRSLNSGDALAREGVSWVSTVWQLTSDCA